jgi:hypothetical protein
LTIGSRAETALASLRWPLVEAIRNRRLLHSPRKLWGEPVLQDVINPSSISATMSSASLEAGWRDTPSGKYFFVLNKTKNGVNGATVTLTGIGDASSATVFDEARSVAIVDGVITDDFPALERHIYVVTP